MLRPVPVAGLHPLPLALQPRESPAWSMGRPAWWFRNRKISTIFFFPPSVRSCKERLLIAVLASSGAELGR